METIIIVNIIIITINQLKCDVIRDQNKRLKYGLKIQFSRVFVLRLFFKLINAFNRRRFQCFRTF